MRENSLGFDDGLDSVELLQDIEADFNIKFEDDEAIAMETVGDLFDAILAKVPPTATGKCASAMAFYRLRQVLGDANLKPSSDLTYLNAPGAKAALADLQAKTGLNLPGVRYARLGNIGCTTAMVGGLASAVTLFVIFESHSPVALTILVAGAMAMIAGTAAVKHDKGLLPETCETLGGIARQTAVMSYGLLVRRGARARQAEMWDILATILHAYSNVPAAEINRDTTFYKGQKRKTA